MKLHFGRLLLAVAILVAVAVASSGCLVRRALGSQIRQRIRSRQASSTGEAIQIAGLKVSVWRPAGRAPAPLVIFSHGFHGSSTQSTFLMKALADHGYLVFAPNHKDAGMGKTVKPEAGFGDAAAWSDATYRDRADDIRSLLKALKSDSKWSSLIDWSEVALAGHSLGGYTVLGLAGGWQSWLMPEVKAVLALSPYCTPYIQKKTLGAINAPVMYQSGSRDFGIGPFVKKSGGAYDQTSSPAFYIEFDGAGHLAWTDLNTTYQAGVTSYSLAFLDKYVRGDRTANPARELPNVSELRVK